MPKLEKLLARNLGCSAKRARALLAAEDIKLPCDIPAGALPYPLRLGEQSLLLHDSFHLMLHKPLGCVTALSDREHATAAGYIASAPLAAELRPVGRLDLDTSGLLLWTTDGVWLHELTHPRAAIPRIYHVALARAFSPAPPDLVLRDGHRPRILDLRPAPESAMHPGLARPRDATVWATITLAEGAYHEVRRIFAALGSHVVALCRVAFGGLTLPPDLPAGQWIEITRR